MIRLVHDCDPGNDDALAILVAAGHPALSLAAVTTGAGHLASDRTARNAAIVVAMLSGDVPVVAAGARGPLVRERLVAQMLDQSGGLDPDRADLPAVALSARPAFDLLRQLTSAEPGITVVATGPLTNLALALRMEPGLATTIGRIVFLGGSLGLGNKTAAAEWNVLCDPDAAAIVLGAGIPVTMIPVDTASAVVIDPALLDDVSAIGTPVGAFAAELLGSLCRTHRPSIFHSADAPLNDPLAPLVAASPALARTVPARVEIELAGRFTYGRTVVDVVPNRSGPANCDVVVEFDVPATRAAFVDAVARAALPRTRNKVA